MNDLRTLANPFQFSDVDVRTAIDDHQEIWFCARDVCQILDITWSGATLENVKKEWVIMLSLNTIKGERDTNFISIGGVFHLIMRSNKPNVKEFQHWVCGEVLPSLWKTGGYSQLSAKDYIAVVKQITELTDRLTMTKNAFTYQMLLQPLRNLCNMAGHPMPDATFLSLELDQVDLVDLVGLLDLSGEKTHG